MNKQGKGQQRDTKDNKETTQKDTKDTTQKDTKDIKEIPTVRF